MQILSCFSPAAKHVVSIVGHGNMAPTIGCLFLLRRLRLALCFKKHGSREADSIVFGFGGSTGLDHGMGRWLTKKPVAETEKAPQRRTRLRKTTGIRLDTFDY